jgi:hypothetical protein
MNLVFDEGTKPIRWLFHDAETRASQIREKRLNELTRLSSSVNELRSSVKTIADATLQEFEKERFEAAARLDQEQTKARQLERRARALKLKQTDLEATMKHQQLERESVERLMKQIDDARHEWEESCTDPSSAIAQKIQKEIEGLRSELANEGTEEFERLLDDCVAMMNTVKDGLRDEMCQMDMIERWAVTRMRNPTPRAPAGKTEGQSKQHILQAAKERIEACRKRREMTMKEVNDSMRSLNDSLAQ